MGAGKLMHSVGERMGMYIFAFGTCSHLCLL